MFLKQIIAQTISGAATDDERNLECFNAEPHIKESSHFSPHTTHTEFSLKLLPVSDIAT